MDEKKKKYSDEEISQDWFEDHESYDEEEEAKEFLEEETNEILEEDEEFNQRVRHFLANQKKDVSLEKMLEFTENSFKENLPQPKESMEKTESNIDYLAGNKIDEMKYEVFEPDTKFSRTDLSSSERILEEQKMLYKHLKSSGGEMIGEKKSEWKPTDPEQTMKKDYFTKKRI